MREGGRLLEERLCPVKALPEQIPPLAAQRSDYIFPHAANGAVQASAMQAAHQLYGAQLQGACEHTAWEGLQQEIKPSPHHPRVVHWVWGKTEYLYLDSQAG